MRVGSSAKQEAQGLLPILYHTEIYRLRDLLQGVLDEKDIVRVIFRKQNMHTPPPTLPLL
jgi:hypothetical protein